MKKHIAAFVAALLLSPAALAVVVIQPLSVSTDMGEATQFSIVGLANQVGLLSPYDPNVTDGSATDYQTYIDSMPSHILPTSGDSTWVSQRNPPTPTGVIDFVLPEPFFLTNIAIWTGSAPSLSALDAFHVLIDDVVVLRNNAVDGRNDSDSIISVQSWEFDLIPLLATSVVRLQFLSNHASSANGNFTTISEVAFGGSLDPFPPVMVPEPATAALLGIFLVGFAFRKNPLKYSS